MTHCTQIVENRTISPLPHPWSLQNNSHSDSRNWSNKILKNVNEPTCSLSLPPPNFWDCTRRGVEQSDRLVMLSNWTVTLKCRSLLKAHTKWKSSNEQSTAVRARWYASIPQSLAAKQMKEQCPYGECKTLSELHSPPRS